MVEQITREQVERAIEDAKARERGPRLVFGPDWEGILPRYALTAWHRVPDDDVHGYIAALTRWRDSLPETSADDTGPERLRAQQPPPAPEGVVFVGVSPNLGGPTVVTVLGLVGSYDVFSAAEVDALAAQGHIGEATRAWLCDAFMHEGMRWARVRGAS